MSHKEIFDILKSHNIKSLIIKFSGGGDEGGIDRILVKYFTGDSSKYRDLSELHELFDEVMREALEAPIWDEYCTFAGNFYVNGKLIWNTEDSSVKITGSESQKIYEDIDEVIQGSE